MFRPMLRSSVSLLRTTAPSAFSLARLPAARFLSQEARSQIENALKASPLVLFMKGTPQRPECGFSRAVVQILDAHGVSADKMKTYNVLEDSELRSGIKEFSEWPTIPQVYVNGEFVGGCDIVMSMHQSGELETLLETNNLIPPMSSEAEASTPSPSS